MVVLRIRGEAQTLSPQEPSALTSFTTDLQEAQEPFEFEVWQRSETQTTPTKVNPALQVGGTTQAPAVRVKVALGQVRQSPESALKVLQFLLGSMLLQVPLKNWVGPQP